MHSLYRMIYMNKQGFTLLELLVLMSIVGMLSSVLVSEVVGIDQKARDTVRVSDIVQLSRAMFLSQDDFTGEFQVLSNTTPQAIGTEFPEVPENNTVNDGVYGWLDNRNAPDKFCAWATLQSEIYGSSFFIATEFGNGFIDEEPQSFEDCGYYQEENRNTGFEDPNKKTFVCHLGKKGKRKTLNIGKGAVAAHLSHGDTEGPC